MDVTAMKTITQRFLGGVSIANDISVYPKSFDEKDLVTDYLDKWNADGELTYGNTTLAGDSRLDITYTDTLELVISMINTMIDVMQICRTRYRR